MRIATVLAVASAYGILVDALTQDHADHPMLRELSNENQSLLVPAKLLLMADTDAACSWGANLKCDLDAKDNNLKLGSSCKLPVPVPTDNYVGDLRHNKYDITAETAASDKPYIEITSSFGEVSTTSGKVAWTGYVTNPTAAQSKITFNEPGLYDLSIAATDYDRTAICDGCVAIRDTFRPRFAGEGCPVGLSSPATLTTTSLAAFKSYEESYDSYVHDNNVVNNADSGADCGSMSSKWKVFYTTVFDDSNTCFGDVSLATNVGRLEMSPFPANLQAVKSTLDAARNEMCQWCCKKSRTLKEEYVAYTCPDSEPASTCEEGTGNACGMDMCLEATGDDIAVADIALKETVQTASTGVIDALPNSPADSDATKNVYYSIPCTDFDEDNAECHYKVKLSELLDVETKFAAPFPTPDTDKINDYVFWRYNLDGGSWFTWDPSSDNDISFTDPSTTVHLEAWAGCGIIGETFSFNVNLYVHSELTCANFDEMWTGVDVEKDDGGAYCAIAGSEFTILNLAYDYTKVLPHPADTVTGVYAGVKCEIMVKENDADTADTTFATFVDGSDQTLNKNIAVELVHNPHTAQKTAGTIKCTFTRTAHVNEVMLADDTPNPHSLTCTHEFYVTDCDAPELYIGDQADVCADTCAGKTDPGVNEQCGGTVVTSTAAATAVSTSDKTCCDDCDPGLKCIAVGSSDIKRCEIPVIPLLLAQLTAAEQKVFASQTLTALLGASAMVAVVALIAVKRRANTAARATESEDAYYPLLE